MFKKEEAVKGFKWSAIEKWGGSLISFAIFIVLARLLEPESFGLVAMASVFIAFVSLFLDQGFQEAIIQRSDLAEEHLDTAFWSNMCFGSLMTVCGLLSAKYIALLYREPRLAPIVSYLSLSFLFTGLSSTQKAILTRRLEFKHLAVRSLVSKLAGGLVGIGCALKGLGVWSLVYQQLIASALSFLLLWRVSGWHPKLYFSYTHFRDLFVFGISMIGHKIVNFIDTRSDDFIIAYFLGPTVLGYYRVAYRIFQVLNSLIVGVVSTVALPIFSSLQKDTEKLEQIFDQGSRFLSILSFPVFIFIILMGTEIIQVVFGNIWEPSAPVMKVLAFAGVLHVILTYNGTLIISQGKPVQLLKIRIFSTIITVLSYLVAVRWGIVAVALAFVIVRYLLIAPMHFRLLHQISGMGIRARIFQYRYAGAASLGFLITILCIKYYAHNLMNNYWLLLVSIITGFAVYAISLQKFFPQTWVEIVDYAGLALKS